MMPNIETTCAEDESVSAKIVQKYDDCPVVWKREAEIILTLSPRRILWLFVFIITVLVLMHLTTQGLKYFFGHDTLLGLTHQFDLDRENNIPTWYSSSSLLLCSALLALIWHRSRQAGTSYAVHWLVLSLIFLLLSLDEAASFHEMVSALLRKTFDLRGHLHHSWVIPYGLFIVILGVSFARFLQSLPALIWRLFLFAGLLYVGGALGLEILDTPEHYLVGGSYALYSMIIVTVEEACEMLGIVVFLYALCSYLGNDAGLVKIVFEPSASSGS
jgi:hypothetical protein